MELLRPQTHGHGTDAFRDWRPVRGDVDVIDVILSLSLLLYLWL